jgi:hypothetical protein
VGLLRLVHREPLVTPYGFRLTLAGLVISAVLLSLIALSLGGCTFLGYQSATVSEPRDVKWKRIGDFKAFLGYVEGYGVARCEIGTLPKDVCERGKAALTEAKTYILAEETAALAKGETVDPAVLQKLLPVLLQSAAKFGLTALIP